MACAISIGTVTIFFQSIQFALLYLAVAVAGIAFVLFSFCSKCPCRDNACRHIVFGPVAGKLFKRPEEPYSFPDIVLTTIGIAFIAMYPQFRLVKMPLLMIAFLVASIVLVVEIITNICKTCDNIFCPGYVKGKK